MKNCRPQNFQTTKKFHGLNTPPYKIYTEFSTNSGSSTAFTKKTLKKNRPLNLLPEHNLAFKNFVQLVAKITQNKNFDQHLDFRIVCDASNTVLGAALEQHSAEG